MIGGQPLPSSNRGEPREDSTNSKFRNIDDQGGCQRPGTAACARRSDGRFPQRRIGCPGVCRRLTIASCSSHQRGRCWPRGTGGNPGAGAATVTKGPSRHEGRRPHAGRQDSLNQRAASDSPVRAIMSRYTGEVVPLENRSSPTRASDSNREQGGGRAQLRVLSHWWTLAPG